MRIIKAIFNQAVDIIFGVILLGLLIWHITNPAKDFTTALWPVVGYIAFNIINKVQMNLKKQDDGTDNSDVFDPDGSGT
jgi:hypothetical protein